MPNSELGALAAGFAMGLQTGDGELIPAEAPPQDFATEYFQRISGWWETRTLEMAQTMTLRLFPPASAQTVAAARTWLEEHPAAPKGLPAADAGEPRRCRAGAGGSADVQRH